MNSETPVANRTVHALELSNRHRMHLQRLHEISVAGKRRAKLGNSWSEGPQPSQPVYRHLRENLKKQQVESRRTTKVTARCWTRLAMVVVEIR